MSSFTILLAFVLSAVTYALYKRYSRFSLCGIPGPDSDSFLFGNFIERTYKWQEKYGDVVRLHAPFGGERLLISDPKALHCAWQVAGPSFEKPPARISLSDMAIGPGLVNVIGDIHTRQRRVMMPGFGRSEAKSALPVFYKHAAKLSAKWTDMISNEGSEQMDLDVHYWLSRASLDAIGEVAFDYQLGALDHIDNELTRGYSTLIFDLFSIQKNKDILLINLLDTLPRALTRFLIRHLPSHRLEHGRQTGANPTNSAKQLVDEKYAALREGKPSKDIMSLLVKANVNAHATAGGKGLSDDELLAQMNTILIAGHDTTTNSLSFALLEFAKNKSIQDKLSTEIRETRQRMTAEGRSDFTPADLDTMHYLGAVVKETLRVHPVVYNQFRQAEKDEVLPLHRPIVTKAGRTLTELPIKKGTILIASTAGYNRHKDVFGQDAHTFNPDRWLKKETLYQDGSLPGVYANVFSFGGGARSCIGWRFALFELQAFFIELVGNFEFSLAPDVDPKKIRREACFAMTPTMTGEEEKGSQLKMTVKLVSEED